MVLPVDAEFRAGTRVSFTVAIAWLAVNWGRELFELDVIPVSIAAIISLICALFMEGNVPKTARSSLA